MGFRIMTQVFAHSHHFKLKLCRDNLYVCVLLSRMVWTLKPVIFVFSRAHLRQAVTGDTVASLAKLTLSLESASNQWNTAVDGDS